MSYSHTDNAENHGMWARAELDTQWTSFMDPYPSGLKGFSSGHYDQSGRVRGTLTAHGTTYDIDCFASRDHSWGPRPFVNRPKLNFDWAVASQDSAFSLLALGRDVPASKGYQHTPANDPLRGTVESVDNGWYLRDGRFAEIVSGTSTITERDNDGRPRTVVVDDLGRELHAEGQAQCWLKWPGYQMLTYWTGTRWQYDGHTAWGEVQDMFADQESRRIFRRHL